MFWFDCAFLLFWLHSGGIDAMITDEAKVPLVIRNDWTYLGGRVVTILFMIYTLYFAFPFTLFQLNCHIGYDLFFGSIAWDWFYGWILYNDPLYPFEDWFNGWGFKGQFAQEERIIFDALRGTAGFTFLLIKGLHP